MVVQSDVLFDRVLGVGVGLFPSLSELLHEFMISLDSVWLPDLLDGEVAASTHDDGNIVECVVAESIEGDLSLLALVAFVKSNHGERVLFVVGVVKWPVP